MNGTGNGATLRDHLLVVWHRKWLLLLVVALATGAAYASAVVQTKMYEAAAQLIYAGTASTANPLASGQIDATQRTVELQSVATLITSPDLEVEAERLIDEEYDGDWEALDYEVDAEVVAGTDETAGTSTFSSVVAIIGRSDDAEYAAVVANAYADALIKVRRDEQRRQADTAIKAVQAALDRMTTETQKASSDHILLQQRLHDLQIIRAAADGSFRVVVPAATPEEPYTPKPLRAAAVGLALGLFVGVGLVFLLESLDTRLRTDDEVAALLGLPILGRIPHIRSKVLDQSVLVTLSDPKGTSAEAFRMLRTNLSFMHVDGEVRSLLITSCVQGEGKSVAAANLAVTLALAGSKVVVVDADLRRPRLHKYFSLSNARGVSLVATGQAKLDECIQSIVLDPETADRPGYATRDGAQGETDRIAAAGSLPRMYVLTSGPQTPNPGEIVSSKRLGSIIRALSEKADIVIVDAPAMLAVGDTPALADKVDGLVFLVAPDVVRRQTLMRAREQLDKLPCRMLGTVIARRRHRVGGYYGAGYAYYREADDDAGWRTRDRGGAGRARS